jgi:MFS transporter, ACS family, allantoate permease
MLLPDSPVSARYLSDREKYICIDLLKNNNTGIEDKKIKWYQIRECIMDPRTWLLFVFVCAQNIPNGGLITFASIIVSGLGYSRLLITLLGIPTGVLATAWQLLLAIPCSKIKHSRCAIIAIANIVPMISAVLMWQLPRSNKHGLPAAYYIFYTYWGPYVLSTSLPMGNTSGHSKKVAMNAIFFTAYCIGNIIGPQVFRRSDPPTHLIILTVTSDCWHAWWLPWLRSPATGSSAMPKIDAEIGSLHPLEYKTRLMIHSLILLIRRRRVSVTCTKL